MTIRADEPASEIEVVDRFDGGCSWIAHPEETIQRASHALVADGHERATDDPTQSGAGVWVIDPVDGDGVDELLAEYGDVAGVVVCLDRHRRDADAVAARHDVAVWLPDWFEGVAETFDAPVERFGAKLPGTNVRAHVVTRSRFWQEVALYDPDHNVLVVPESLGTTSYFTTAEERLGVHPLRRFTPPTDRLDGFEPDRILVGHGPAVDTDASDALATALSGARRRAPRLYAATIRGLLPV